MQQLSLNPVIRRGRFGYVSGLNLLVWMGEDDATSTIKNALTWFNPSQVGRFWDIASERFQTAFAEREITLEEFIFVSQLCNAGAGGQ